MRVSRIYLKHLRHRSLFDEFADNWHRHAISLMVSRKLAKFNIVNITEPDSLKTSPKRTYFWTTLRHNEVNDLGSAYQDAERLTAGSRL